MLRVISVVVTSKKLDPTRQLIQTNTCDVKNETVKHG